MKKEAPKPISEYQKASEYLAAERTFLAWIRTSVAIISLGFVVAKFGVWLRELAGGVQRKTNEPGSGLSLPIGLAMMLLGAAFALLALWHYHAVNRAIEAGNVSANRTLAATVAIAVALLAVVVSAYLLIST